MLDNPFGEDIFPNIQSKPPLVQLGDISSHPIACYLGEETDPHLSTASFQVVVESDKVSPQPPFLQAKQPQFPQALLIRLLLQTLHQLCCPSLDTLQHLNVSLVVRRPKLNMLFEGHDHFPTPAGHAISDTSQDASGLLGHLSTLPARIQPAINQHPQAWLCVNVGLKSANGFQSGWVRLWLLCMGGCGSAEGVSLRAKQPQLPQPLLIRLVLQTLHQLRCPSLDTLQHLNVSLVVRGPKLNMLFEVRPHQCKYRGTITSLVLLATLFPIQSERAATSCSQCPSYQQHRGRGGSLGHSQCKQGHRIPPLPPRLTSVPTAAEARGLCWRTLSRWSFAAEPGAGGLQMFTRLTEPAIVSCLKFLQAGN
ncbi:hypothetical protein QYF61_021218 [Mycteria americana]|uniref:Uncharacterized protein n=1 Tax=Mycteria americana TaxID=33587 RepID=A0AAN7S429_MYCAM|nr:hypothetical protein QYF61_021218 [Mycteria americana]